MNEFLADLYGTRENIGSPQDTSDDVEKLAEAQVLDEFLTNEGVDVDQLDGDTILKVAYDLFGDESEIVKSAAEDSEDDDEEEDEEEDAQEKLAEADFLGRVMAHSFVDEQAELEKEAAIGAGFKEVGRGLSELIGKGHKQVQRLGGRLGSKKHWKGVADSAKKSSGKAKKKELFAGGKLKGGLKPKAVLERMASPEVKRSIKNEASSAIKNRRSLYGYGALGGGTLLAGGGTAAALSGGKKKSSALDALAEERALEIMKEAGLIDAEPEEKLAASVEERAWEMLYANGLVED